MHGGALLIICGIAAMSLLFMSFTAWQRGEGPRSEEELNRVVLEEFRRIAAHEPNKIIETCDGHAANHSERLASWATSPEEPPNGSRGQSLGNNMDGGKA